MRRENEKWGRVLQNVISFAVASAFVLMVPAFCSAAPTLAPAMKCADVAGLSLPRTQIISASETTSASGNYCHVIGVIDKRVSMQDPDHDTYGIGFELNLPDAWIGRFEMQGGGGTDGSLADPKGSMRLELAQGWAVASDDGGHEDAAETLTNYAMLLRKMNRPAEAEALEARASAMLKKVDASSPVK